jgi:hypothetical protein
MPSWVFFIIMVMLVGSIGLILKGKILGDNR